MIRIVCRETDVGDHVHTGGPVHVSHRTFDVDAPAVQAWLQTDPEAKYTTREVVGVEVVETLQEVAP